MGIVYKSFDPVIRRPIALKTIRKELLLDEQEAEAFAARFRNEAQAAGRLLHPGIVAVYEYGEDAQFAFIAMEYVEGSSLRQYFERGVHFEEHDVISVMAQLLDALQYAHEQGVWHRDIKPANIIIMSSGRVKVADFGIARVESSTLTQVGVVMGTPGFIAPEQYLGGNIDHRVDLFAAGVVLYEMLTARPPFSGSKESVMYQVCHESPQHPSALAADRSYARFDAVVLRALAKRPEDRYASAADFRADLLAAHDRPVSPTVSEETLMRAGPPPEVPAHLGPRPPAPPRPGSSGHGRSHTMPTEALLAAGWDAAQIAAVESSLAHVVGPIARIMVRRAAPEAADLASLVHRLAEQLPPGADRERFLHDNARVAATTGVGKSKPAAAPADDDATVVLPSAGAAPPAPGPTPEDLARAARLLAVHVGPIAQVLVRQAAQAGVSRADFLERLTARLSNDEREQFLVAFGRPH